MILMYNGLIKLEQLLYKLYNILKLLTMVIYVIGPIINIFVSSIIRCLKKCFDTCGLDDNKFTRKLT